jgi:hypothetical protein
VLGHPPVLAALACRAPGRRGTTGWLGTIKSRPNRPVDRREEADAVLDADDIIGAWSG